MKTFGNILLKGTYFYMIFQTKKLIPLHAPEKEYYLLGPSILRSRALVSSVWVNPGYRLWASEIPTSSIAPVRVRGDIPI